MPLIPCEICQHQIASVAPSCPKCGAENAALARATLTTETLKRAPCEVCDHDITQLDEYCPSCGALNKAFDKIALMDFAACENKAELKTAVSLEPEKPSTPKKSTSKTKTKLYEKLGTCPTCNHAVSKDAWNCPSCAQPITECQTCLNITPNINTACHHCGEEYPQNGSPDQLTFCDGCQHDMSEKAYFCQNCNINSEANLRKRAFKEANLAVHEATQIMVKRLAFIGVSLLIVLYFTFGILGAIGII